MTNQTNYNEGVCADCGEHCEMETNDEANKKRREMMSNPTDTNQASEDELRAEREDRIR